MKFISIMSPCYNEEANVEELHARIKATMEKLPDYSYEHILIDNASVDGTVDVLRRIAAADPHVKVIVNTRNFGHVRSPYHGLLQAKGDAVITLASDLQNPPELIEEFVRQWEKGYKVVIAIRSKSEESALFYILRRLYYSISTRLSEVQLVEHFTGFGLYDKEVIDHLRRLDDPYPYFRGMICDLGYERAVVKYDQPQRKRGLSKNNFYTLYDVAMLGITNHSKVPLRLATFTGFLLGSISLMVAFVYLLYKLLFWNTFQLGIAPLVTGLFFLSGVQLFFTGILGEYIGAIHTQVMKRPLVVEKERINFD